MTVGLMLNKIPLYLATVKHLKWKQIRFQLYYRIRNKIIGRGRYQVIGSTLSPKIVLLNLQESIDTSLKYHGNKKFCFLNQEAEFKNNIDWNFSKFGKLWTYNLNYFEFLTQKKISKETGIQLIHDFISKLHISKDGLEPYPISLRIIFWIRFLRKHNINQDLINNSVFAQAKILSKNTEYHLLGNHLLENGFAFLFIAYYFNDLSFYNKAKKIITEELEEQILEDGGHFELSPMYHQIILYRLLDSINLIINNPSIFELSFSNLLINKARLMLGWIANMTFSNGDIPLFNDSAKAIAPNSSELNAYAARLNVYPEKIELKDSGYRQFNEGNWKAIIDVGKIGANYIAGHGHCDIFSFSMHVGNQAFIVDTGISTYENNEQRWLERSTSSHNTIQIENFEQSQVWGAFRVGKRAHVNVISDTFQKVSAMHNGFKNVGLIHYRSFQVEGTNFCIEDKIEGPHDRDNFAYFHFHPKVKIYIKENSVITPLGKLVFDSPVELNLKEYQFSNEFNTRIASTKVVVKFNKNLRTKIIVE